jgi:hypothetical protein
MAILDRGICDLISGKLTGFQSAAFRSRGFLLRASRLREDELEELRCSIRSGERREPEHKHVLPVVMLVIDIGPRKRLRTVENAMKRIILLLFFFFFF